MFSVLSDIVLFQFQWSLEVNYDNFILSNLCETHQKTYKLAVNRDLTISKNLPEKLNSFVSIVCFFFKLFKINCLFSYFTFFPNSFLGFWWPKNYHFVNKYNYYIKIYFPLLNFRRIYFIILVDLNLIKNIFKLLLKSSFNISDMSDTIILIPSGKKFLF